MSNGESAGAANAPGRENTKKKPAAKKHSGRRAKAPNVRYAALDLGTNNCRLLIAAPSGKDFRIIDAFSRIVRLGEGLSTSGYLSETAMARAEKALLVCAEKIARRGVTDMRCIATQACRSAENGAAFLDKIRTETGLQFDIITTEEEARLAAAGCADLIDHQARAALIFDIGGGSTEISWMRRPAQGAAFEIAAWTSMPFGVVSLAERWGGKDLDPERYEAVVADVQKAVSQCGDPAMLKAVFEAGEAHLLGTSGTVTSIAGVQLELDRYRRDRVDGMWLGVDDARATIEKLRAMSFDERAREPCIGVDRADLVVCGCAILEALIREWPVARVRVADRGLREGILADLARQVQKQKRRRRRGMKKTA